MAEMPASKHLVYAIYRLATHPGILRELTPDQWALNRENPNYQKITSYARAPLGAKRRHSRNVALDRHRRSNTTVNDINDMRL